MNYSKPHNISFEDETAKLGLKLFILSNNASCYGLFIRECKFVQPEPGLNDFTSKYSLYYLCEFLFESMPTINFSLIIPPAFQGQNMRIITNKQTKKQ